MNVLNQYVEYTTNSKHKNNLNHLQDANGFPGIEILGQCGTDILCILKVIVQLKMKMLSLITHPHFWSSLRAF